MPANAVAVTDAERIRWETVEQLFDVGSFLLATVRVQACERGIGMADLFKWMMTEKGDEIVEQSLEFLFENYARRT